MDTHGSDSTIDFVVKGCSCCFSFPSPILLSILIQTFSGELCWDWML